MKFVLRDLVGDESGGALIEYALVLALVSMVAIVALNAFGYVLTAFFGDSSRGLTNVAQDAK